MFTKDEPLTLQQLCEDTVRNHDLEPSSYPTMKAPKVMVEGGEKILNKLNPAKASGPDGISPRVLKEGAHEIAPALALIYNRSLETGVVPTDWKTANVCPVFKKGQKYDASNYRPIPLTCIASKLMEHIIVHEIMDHAKREDILYPLQHGFREQRSCETQLTAFLDDMSLRMSEGKQSDVLIMDFSKAFDKVNHSLLLHKLNSYGIRGEVNQWIGSFLHGRRQCVVVDGEKSDYDDVA